MVLTDAQKQAEIARKAAEAVSQDPVMLELMEKMKMGSTAKERRTLRQKKRQDIVNAAIVVDPERPPLPLNAVTKIFEEQPKKRSSSSYISRNPTH